MRRERRERRGKRERRERRDRRERKERRDRRERREGRERRVRPPSQINCTFGSTFVNAHFQHCDTLSRDAIYLQSVAAFARAAKAIKTRSKKSAMLQCNHKVIFESAVCQYTSNFPLDDVVQESFLTEQIKMQSYTLPLCFGPTPEPDVAMYICPERSSRMLR